MAGLKSFTRTLSSRNLHGSFDRMTFNVWENTKSSTTQVTVINRDAAGLETKHKGKIEAFPTWDDALAKTEAAIKDAEAMGWRHIGKSTRPGVHGSPKQPFGPFTAAQAQAAQQQAQNTAQAQNQYVPPAQSRSRFNRNRTYAPPRPAPGGQAYNPGGTHGVYGAPAPVAPAPVVPAPGPIPTPGSDFTNMDEAARAIVKAGYLMLAKKHHPDVGGQPGTMAVLNEAKDQLNEVLDLIKK